MSHTYTSLVYHIVFSTKRRCAMIEPPLKPRLHAYLIGTIDNVGGKALAVGGASDHVHILARLRQDKALADVLRDVKSCSSGWVHETFRGYGAFAWQNGYAAFTVSESQVEKVAHYVQSQERHHRKQSYEDELLAFLDAHGISHDRRYAFG